MEESTRGNTDHQNKKYLTFLLNRQSCGIHVGNIVQIIAIPEITPIPQTSEYIVGVVNHSGRIIPIMDLRVRLKLPWKEYDDRTSIIIVEAHYGQASTAIGLVVDNVLEVIDIDRQNIDEMQSAWSGQDQNYIDGLAKIKGKVILLLDTDHLLSVNEINELKNVQYSR